MKSILITIDSHTCNVVSYKNNRRDLQKEKELVIKFMNSEICDVKEMYEVTRHSIVIVSKQDTTYNVSWKSVTLWDESELED